MGKPTLGNASVPPPEFIGRGERTGRSETSQYPREKKTNSDSLSSGERKGNSLNRSACRPGLRDRNVGSEMRVQERWKAPPKRVIDP